ncbi:hypothetical protein M0R45_007588 [Rubus argutus]|uniref:Uncharacterized protein n=1 Tax=Rubus argutus TaxID=59490 RepID=A0AAW1XY49_RUBAR
MRRQLSRHGGGGSGVGGVGVPRASNMRQRAMYSSSESESSPAWPLGPLPLGPRLAVVVVHVAVASSSKPKLGAVLGEFRACRAISV